MMFEQRVTELGLQLPPEPLLPPGVRIPFDWVRVAGERCVLSGHGALGHDGAPAGPFGRVPSEVSLEDAQQSARLTVLAMLSALRSTLGTLDPWPLPASHYSAPADRELDFSDDPLRILSQVQPGKPQHLPAVTAARCTQIASGEPVRRRRRGVRVRPGRGSPARPRVATLRPGRC
jgi:hypothetical protein